MRQLIYLFAGMLLIACGGESTEESAQKESFHHQHEQQDPTDRIAELEAIVYSDTATVLNVSVAVELAGLYTHVVKKNPTDSAGADLLFKAGELYMNAKHGNKAIATFQDVHARFPASERSPIARFLKGFVAETVLEDDVLAKRYYQEFVTAHPDHKLAEDAQMSVELLGLSDEELLEKLKSKTAS